MSVLLASMRRLGLRRTVATPHGPVSRRYMHLSPRELDHLQLAQVGFVAQRRLARGVRLNAPEATALIATQMLEMIREGTAVATLMETGKQLLGRRQVQAGVADMVAEVQVEGTFPDGTKLLTVRPSRAPRSPAPAPAPATPASFCQTKPRPRSPAPFSSRAAQPRPSASALASPTRVAVSPMQVHSPIVALDGDMTLALYGSALPLPDLAAFGAPHSWANSNPRFVPPPCPTSAPPLPHPCPPSPLPSSHPTPPPTPAPCPPPPTPTPTPGVLEKDYDVPGATFPAEGLITLNAGRELIELGVVNTGDRPIQVGSHYHFIETNPSLMFDRAASFGKRLNVPAGASVRFEPGESKTITLVAIGGKKVVISGNRLVDGAASPERLAEVMDRVIDRGFLHAPSESPPAAGTPLTMSHASYNAMFGPTVGDRVRLGDTGLLAQVEW